jgi:hypothetical protein
MVSTLDACLCIGVVVGDEFVVSTSSHLGDIPHGARAGNFA